MYRCLIYTPNIKILAPKIHEHVDHTGEGISLNARDTHDVTSASLDIRAHIHAVAHDTHVRITYTHIYTYIYTERPHRLRPPYIRAMYRAIYTVYVSLATSSRSVTGQGRPSPPFYPGHYIYYETPVYMYIYSVIQVSVSVRANARAKFARKVQFRKFTRPYACLNRRRVGY